MVVGALNLLLALVVIFGVAWVICYILATYAKQVPPQVQSFIWLVAAIIAIIKVVQWAGLF